MKNNFANKTIAIFLTFIFVFGLIPSTGFAQTNPSPSPFGEIRGFNKSVFDSRFSRADREIDPGRWLEEAKIGITQAICAWEMIAAGLYENPLVFEEAKNQIEKWSNEELEARFSQWLTGRFFGKTIEEAVMKLSANFGETQKNYSWHLDDEGNVIFDDKTGDPLIIRPGDENREFSQDLLKWRSETKELVKTNGASFDSVLFGLYPELLAYIPEELRETMSGVIEKTGAAVSGTIKREFENIAAREERIFTTRRTRDIWSLRKKSDDEAARIFTERLIAETEEACARGIEEINARIEEASAGTGDLAIMGEEWLKLYREQFERGLKAWEEAEERFFIRRIEWEQDSFRLFSEGEETWLAAFNQFENERQKWELKVKELFQSGEMLFKNISENFEKGIVDAKEEFRLNMEMRIGAGTVKVKALIDMYLVCASAAVSTKENIYFWQEQAEIGKKDPSQSGFSDWLYQERMKIWRQTEYNYKRNLSYILQFVELDRLKRLAEAEYDPENGEITEEVFLKIKNEAEINYLQHLEIFNKNHEYLFQVQDIIAGKMTFAEETLFANRNKDKISDSKKYESFIEMKKSYDLYVSYMEKAEDSRNRIIDNYAELMGTGALKDILAHDVSSEDFFLDEYQLALIRAKALVLYWERRTAIAEAVTAYAGEIDAGRMTEAEGIRAWESAKAAYNESLSIYEAELKKLEAIGTDIQKQRETLDKLAQKMSEEEEKLNRLNQDYSAIIAASITNTESFTSRDINRKYTMLAEEYGLFQLKNTDAAYKTVLEYGLQWGISKQRETAEKILDIYINGDGAAIQSLEELRETGSETDLKIRLAIIDLFTDTPEGGYLRAPDSAYSGADWYLKAKGIPLPYGEKLGAQLAADYNNSYRILLEKRLDLELLTLQNFLDQFPELEKFEPEDFQYELSEFGAYYILSAVRIHEILSGLKTRLNSGEGHFIENDNESNEIINFFVSGYSFFNGLEESLTEDIAENFFCMNLLDLYNAYSAFSSFTQKEIWQDTRNSLNALFAGYALNMDGTSLPEIESICDAILNRPGDFVQNAAKFLREFDNCFSLIPQWLDNEMFNWKNAVIEYIAANALFKGFQPQKKSETLSFEFQGIMDRYRKLSEDAGSVKYMDENTAEMLNAAYKKTRSDEILLYFMFQITSAWEKLNDDAVAAGNNKHWRQFLSSENLEDYDPEITTAIAAASSWKEGTLMDAHFSAVYYTNRVNDSFALFSRNDIALSTESVEFINDMYSNEASRIDQKFYVLKFQYFEFEQSGRAFEISRLKPEEAERLKEIQYEALTAQEGKYNEIRNKYLLEAEHFLESGILYDTQYSVLKKAFGETDTKRFEYEKQDAVRRWASTAYLNSDNANPDDSKNKLEKARIVFTVLSGIYNEDERRSYDNPEYNALYSEYEQNFTRKLKILEAYEAISSESIWEYNNNGEIFREYQKALNKFGGVDTDYSNYESPESRKSWTLKDIITVKDGRLAFAISDNGSRKFPEIDEARAAVLDNYFNTKEIPDGEVSEISQFEEALRGLSQRMSGHLSDEKKFIQWGLARDYLLFLYILPNFDLEFLFDACSGLGALESDGSLGSLLIQNEPLGKKITLNKVITGYSNFNDPFSLGRLAWDKISDEEKADLEFYVILTLLGANNDYIAGFSKILSCLGYQTIYHHVSDKYELARKEAEHWYNLGAYNEMRDLTRHALRQIESVMKETNGTVNLFISGLTSNLSSIEYYSSAYTASCDRLFLLKGENETGQSVEWDDINRTLIATKKMTTADIATLKTYWEKMQKESGGDFTNAAEAIAGLLNWSRKTEEKSKSDLDTFWLANVQKNKKNENDYRIAEEAFIAGTGSIEILKAAAKNAFGTGAAVWKNHLENLHTTLLNNISLYMGMENNFYSEFSSLGYEISSLTSKTLESRYNAELASREIEWEQMLRDMSEKYFEWLNSAALILENGRADWNAGVRKMQEAYKQWNINFQNEYKRVSEEWAIAYLAGLEDKEKWLEQAAAAANQASTEAFLSLTGAEGERLSRFVDTREPFGIRNAVPETQTLMAELLQASGIVNMTGAFGSINNITGAASTIVRRGMGGVSTWDAALIKTAASDLAVKTNTEIADNEARRLARVASLSANEAISSIYDNVNLANKSFRESMDNTFIINGAWRKSGKDYVKAIVKGSTLAQPVISETATVAGYEDFKVEAISLKTNVNEDYLAGLSSVVVMALLDDLSEEIKGIFGEIFGEEAEESTKIKRSLTVEEALEVLVKKEKGEDTSGIGMREQSPGKFGAHIGYEPDTKPQEEMKNKRDSIFYDEGGGELGRLLSDYIYWSVINGIGSAELHIASWEKRIWDDSNSWFKAPSLRLVGQIAGTIASAVISVVSFGAATPLAVGMLALTIAANTLDDLVFGVLDVVYDYKTIEEAGFEFGKTLAINTASTAISGVFSGVSGVGSTVLETGLTKAAVNAVGGTANKIAIQTAMVGAQTAASTLATSAINGITYNRQDGIGYSTSAFKDGMDNLAVNVLSSMTSTFVSSSMQFISNSLLSDKLGNFNNLNEKNFSSLNGLAGALAGQAVNIAMGGDFTFNILNAGLFTSFIDGKLNNLNVGLLELHIGRDGSTTMNLGTGGANISPDNLYASFQGALALNVNNNFKKDLAKSEMAIKNALLAQYDYVNSIQKDQLWDILEGREDITLNDYEDFMAGTTIGRSIGDQMRLAEIPEYEANRDGSVTNNNDLETQMNALPNENLARDILFNDYVDNNYDSRAHYWRVIMNADGTVGKVLFGGDYTNAVIVDADGTERALSLQSGSVSAALAAAVGNGISKLEMNNIMADSGLGFDNESNLWFVKDESARYVPQVQPEETASNSGFWQNATTTAQSALDILKNSFNSITSFIGGLFQKNTNTLPENAQNLYQGNTFTLKDKDGNDLDILLFMLDRENPALEGLLSQHDPAFASIPAIKKWGCNFLATLAYAQLVTGQNLSAEQQMAVWNEAVKNPKIMDAEGTVVNYDLLANIAIQKLGRNEIGLSFNPSSAGVTSSLIGYKIQVPYGNNGYHFLTGDLSKGNYWNPGNTTGKITRADKVYVYAK